MPKSSAADMYECRVQVLAAFQKSEVATNWLTFCITITHGKLSSIMTDLEELKNLLMRVKEESEKTPLKFNIQKN